MKQLLLIVASLLLLGTLSAQSDSIRSFFVTKSLNSYFLLENNDSLFIDSTLLVLKYIDSITSNQINQIENDHILTEINETAGGYHLYKLSPSINYLGTCKQLEVLTSIEELIPSFYLPTEMEVNGNGLPGQYYIAITEISEAWNITNGSEEVTVAILDMGLPSSTLHYGSQQENLENIYHNSGEDEWANWTNPASGPIPGDDDGNGYADDWKGWDFISNDNDVGSTWSHGGWYAGIIGAKESQEYTGIAGGQFSLNKGGVKILPLQVGAINSQTLLFNVNLDVVPTAIEYATEMGADVICLPWSVDISNLYPPVYTQITQAIAESYNSGIGPLFVAPSINSASSFYTYPAHLTDVVAVMATDPNDDPKFSDALAVDPFISELSAPGVDIKVIEDFLPTGYGFFSGTAYASAIVSGIAALAKSVFHDMSAVDLRNLLAETGDPPPLNSPFYNDYITDGWEDHYGYGRINARKALCQGLNEYVIWKIGTNDVWNTTRISFNDIEVSNGKRLTITSEVKMGHGAKIIVEPGAELIIDGGKITNCDYCNNGNNTWGGIVVLGDESESQDVFLNGHPEHQGRVILKNGAIIEHAKYGVVASELDQNGEPTGQSTGGVIIAKESHFLNNETAIWLGEFINYLPGYEGNFNYKRSNRSQIYKCIFEVNDDVIDPYAFREFIRLKNGSGINIRGNSFKNVASSIANHHRGKGIYAEDFPITLSSVCISQPGYPCTQYKNNEFENLFYGIEVSDNLTWVSHTIKNCLFDGVGRGIYLENTHSAMVLENMFKNIPTTSSYGPYGLYIHGGDGFTVEADTFITTPGPTHARGLIVHNTGGNDNEIYRNDFQNLLAGVQAQEVNKDNNLHGLKFICNTHNNLYYDFWVGDNTQSIASNIGIAEAQIYDPGTGDLPMGNVFTSGLRFGDLDFSNKQAEFLTYYYWDDALDKQEPSETSGILMDDKDDENTCPEKATNGGGTNLAQLYASRASAKVALNSSTLILNIWKDGGNEELDEEVQTTLPWEAYVEFNQLMQESPYLSEDVLIEVINNPVFSNLMVKLLMIANPHGSRSDEVMNAIYERVPPMPESYIEEIRYGEEVISQLDLLEGDVAADRHLYNNLGEQIKRLYRTDTTNAWARDSLLNFMSRDYELASRYEYASAQLESGYNEAANQTLEDILSNYELSDVQSEDHQKFTTLMGIKTSMMQSEQPMGFLDEGEVDELMDLVEANRPQITAAAVAMLKQNDPEFVYNEIILEPDTNSVPKRERVTIEEEQGAQLKLYPNPAYDYITVSCDLDQYMQSSYKLQLYNALGQLLHEIVLTADNAEQMIPLGDYLAGNYHFILLGDGQQLANEKFTIIR